MNATSLRAIAQSSAANGEWDLPLGMMAVACEDVIALCDRVAELQATIANERGEGSPPSEGWFWTGAAWNRDGAFLPRCAPTWSDVARRWEPVAWVLMMRGTHNTLHPTARSAMRAADASTQEKR